MIIQTITIQTIITSRSTHDIEVESSRLVRGNFRGYPDEQQLRGATR
jgi:hypothetical protein